MDEWSFGVLGKSKDEGIHGVEALFNAPVLQYSKYGTGEGVLLHKETDQEKKNWPKEK